MSSAVAQTLKEARRIWPELINSDYLRRFVDDGEISSAEAQEILSEVFP